MHDSNLNFNLDLDFMLRLRYITSLIRSHKHETYICTQRNQVNPYWPLYMIVCHEHYRFIGGHRGESKEARRDQAPLPP